MTWDRRRLKNRWRRPYTAHDVKTLRFMLAHNAPLGSIAAEMDRPLKEIDLVSWTVFGRTEEEAVDIINHRLRRR